MGVRVAYGKKGRISAAIASGTIPRDSLIITSDSKESELYFYDANGGSDWVPYIVSVDGKLSPVNAGDISVGDVKVIDGGAANGIQ